MTMLSFFVPSLSFAEIPGGAGKTPERTFMRIAKKCGQGFKHQSLPTPLILELFLTAKPPSHHTQTYRFHDAISPLILMFEMHPSYEPRFPGSYSNHGVQEIHW